MYISVGKYPIKEVLDNVHLDNSEATPYMTAGAYAVSMSSDRYKNFKAHGTTCIACGLEGKYFSLERHSSQPNDNIYHFNLYADNGMMLTKDHIVPKSKGGPDRLENYQVMCESCNSRKGNKTTVTKKAIAVKAKVQALKESHRIMAEAVRKIQRKIDRAIKSCEHEIIKTKAGKAVCAVCSTLYTNFCTESPDLTCHYESNLDPKTGESYITARDGKKIVIHVKGHKEGNCIFCNTPEDKNEQES